MPRPPRLRLLPAPPRDPAAPRRNLSPVELARSLAYRWHHWHPNEHTRAPGTLDHRDVDARVRELAWLVLEQLWDKLATRGCRTGEFVDFETIPSAVGFRPWFLSLVDFHEEAAISRLWNHSGTTPIEP